MERIVGRISETLLAKTMPHARKLLDEIQADFAESNRRCAIQHILKHPSASAEEAESKDADMNVAPDLDALRPWKETSASTIASWVVPAHIKADEDAHQVWTGVYQNAQARINKKLFLYNTVVIKLLDLWQEHATTVRFICVEDLSNGQALGGGDPSSKLSSINVQTGSALRLSTFKSLLFVQSEKCRENLMHGWFTQVAAHFYQEFVKPFEPVLVSPKGDARQQKGGRAISQHPLIAQGQLKPSDSLFNVVSTVMASQIIGLIHQSFHDYAELFVMPGESFSREPYSPFEPEKDLAADWATVAANYSADMQNFTAEAVADSHPTRSVLVPTNGLHFVVHLVFDTETKKIRFDPPLEELERTLLDGAAALSTVLEMIPRVDAVLYRDSSKDEEEMERALSKAGVQLSLLKKFQDYCEVHDRKARIKATNEALAAASSSDRIAHAGAANLDDETLLEQTRKHNYANITLDQNIIESARTQIMNYCKECFATASTYITNYQPYLDYLYGEKIHEEIAEFMVKGEAGQVGFDEYVQVGVR